MSKAISIHIPISKVDEEQRIVWGVATTEAVDSQGDVVDYEASKSAFSKWLGNIREMHQPIAVGKAVDIQFNDEEKQVLIGAKISESTDGENAWTKVKEGILNGFSIGGKVNKIVKDTAKVNGDDVSVSRIVDYDLSETSLVDNPANPEALFVMVKSASSGLQRVEEMHEGNDTEIIQHTEKSFRLPAWHLQFMLPIEKAQSLYDESMSTKKLEKAGVAVVDGDPRDHTAATVAEVTNQAPKKAGTAVPKKVYGSNGVSTTNKSNKAEIKKSIFGADYLIDLACELYWFIQSEQYSGEDVSELNSAYATLKRAAIGELQEPDSIEDAEQDLSVAVELAEKVTSLSKNKNTEITKSTAVVGGEERNENAEVVTTAEENSKPVEDEATEEEVTTEAAEEEEVVETPAEAPAAEATKEEPAKKVETDKALTTSDLAKFSDSLIEKLGDANKEQFAKVLGEFTDKVEKSVASLEGRVKELEDQPAAPKAKASFVEIEKGNEAASEEVEDVKALLKRRDELAADPNLGTPTERMDIAMRLRKAAKNGAEIA